MKKVIFLSFLIALLSCVSDASHMHNENAQKFIKSPSELNISSGRVVRIKDFSSKYVNTRNVDIWLPENYSSNTKYKTLYMHDGQMLFDAKTTWNKQEWKVDEIASRLIASGEVAPFIVIGIWNDGVNRHNEYWPQKPFESMSKEVQDEFYALKRDEDNLLFGGAVNSDNYLKYIVKELIPYIEKNYSVSKLQNSRYIAGSSMGSLISWYALMEYPDIFAGAACISTHWPGVFDATSPGATAFFSYIENNISKLNGHKIYFDYGDQTLDALYPPLQQRVDFIFTNQAYPKNLWQSMFFPGDDHSEKSWSNRLDVPLEFLFSKKEKGKM